MSIGGDERVYVVHELTSKVDVAAGSLLCAESFSPFGLAKPNEWEGFFVGKKTYTQANVDKMEQIAATFQRVIELKYEEWTRHNRKKNTSIEIMSFVYN